MHAHRVLDRRPVASDVKFTALARDREHIQVEVRSESLIEPQFLCAQLAALIQCPRVDKVVVHRFLDLVRVVSGKDDPGDMSLDDA